MENCLCSQFITIYSEQQTGQQSYSYKTNPNQIWLDDYQGMCEMVSLGQIFSTTIVSISCGCKSEN